MSISLCPSRFLSSLVALRSISWPTSNLFFISNSTSFYFVLNILFPLLPRLICLSHDSIYIPCSSFQQRDRVFFASFLFYILRHAYLDALTFSSSYLICVFFIISIALVVQRWDWLKCHVTCASVSSFDSTTKMIMTRNWIEPLCYFVFICNYPSLNLYYPINYSIKRFHWLKSTNPWVAEKLRSSYIS